MAHLLVPFDFSKNARTALDQALLIASKNGKNIDVLHITNKAVCRDYPASWACDETSIEPLSHKVEEVINERKKALQLDTLNNTTAIVEESALITGGIIDHMLQSGAQLVIMGTHGSTGIYDKVFGSNTAVMVNHALFPVLTVPPKWTPVTIEHCIASLKLSKLAASAKTITTWANFLQCSAEAIQFSIIPEGEGALAKQSSIEGIPCRIIKNDIETTLAEDLLRFTSSLQNTILLLFTREKTFLEKLFTPNLAYKLSGAITIPLLSIPINDHTKL